MGSVESTKSLRKLHEYAQEVQTHKGELDKKKKKKGNWERERGRDLSYISLVKAAQKIIKKKKEKEKISALDYALRQRTPQMQYCTSSSY